MLDFLEYYEKFQEDTSSMYQDMEPNKINQKFQSMQFLDSNYSVPV